MVPGTQLPPLQSENPPVITPPSEDKALWMTLLTPILVMVFTPLTGWLALKLGIVVSPLVLATTVLGIVGTSLTFIIGHKMSSTKKATAIIQANAQIAIGQAPTTAAGAAALLNDVGRP